jgi:hypothetical protein
LAASIFVFGGEEVQLLSEPQKRFNEKSVSEKVVVRSAKSGEIPAIF